MSPLGTPSPWGSFWVFARRSTRTRIVAWGRQRSSLGASSRGRRRRRASVPNGDRSGRRAAKRHGSRCASVSRAACSATKRVAAANGACGHSALRQFLNEGGDSIRGRRGHAPHPRQPRRRGFSSAASGFFRLLRWRSPCGASAPDRRRLPATGCCPTRRWARFSSWPRRGRRRQSRKRFALAPWQCDNLSC